MQLKSATLTQVLLNRYAQGQATEFLNHFPEEEANEIQSVKTSFSDPLPALEPAAKKIERIHYTWFEPLFKELPADAAEVLVAAMPESLAAKLRDMLGIAKRAQPLPKPVAAYLAGLVYGQLTGAKKVMPEAFVTPPFSGLSGWSKQEIIVLCDFLGIHDLAEEVRHIVDKKILKNVYDCLSQKEQQYLKGCLSQKEKIPIVALGLDKWGGSQEKLRTALQGRGLLRLGRAVSGSHPDFLWHLAHKLDKGRGQTLIRYYSKQPVSGITPLMGQQVVNLMNILKPKSEA